MSRGSEHKTHDADWSELEREVAAMLKRQAARVPIDSHHRADLGTSHPSGSRVRSGPALVAAAALLLALAGGLLVHQGRESSTGDVSLAGGLVVVPSHLEDGLQGADDWEIGSALNEEGGILYLLSSADLVVEVDQLRLLDGFTTGDGFITNHRFSLDGTAVWEGGSQSRSRVDNLQISESVGVERRPSAALDLEVGDRSYAILQRIDPSLENVPSGVSHSLVVLAVVDEAGSTDVLGASGDVINGQLQRAHQLAATGGESHFDFLVRWLGEYEREGEAGAITDRFVGSMTGVEPDWLDLAPTERVVDPAATPPEVMSGLAPYRVLVDGVGSDDDVGVIRVMSDLGILHLAEASIDSVGGMWLAAGDEVQMEIRTSDFERVLGSGVAPPMPLVGGSDEPPTLFVSLTGGHGGEVRVAARWLRDDEAREVLSEWADPSASAPGPEPRE